MLPDGALDGLRDVHLPEAVALWPLAPGWWLVLAALAGLLLAVALWLRARRRSVRRVALTELARLEREQRAEPDEPRLAVALSALLRRVALRTFPPRDVAALHGDDRLSFLESTGGRRGFPPHVVLALEHAVYADAVPEARGCGSEWIVAVRRWIRRNT